MNAIERRQYEMLLRVRDFGNTYASSFSAAGAARQTLATVNDLVSELTTADMRKMSASVAARAQRKQTARKALTDLLVKSNQLAKLLRGRGQTTPAFELPRSRSDQALLTAGRQFAHDATALDDDFTAHGMPVKLLADTTAAFETAVRDRGMSRSDRIAAGTRIRDLLATAINEARRLDLIVSNELAGDKVVQAVWKQARHVEEARAARGAAPEGPATEPDERAVASGEAARAAETHAAVPQAS
jgi:hypothetical protein